MDILLFILYKVLKTFLLSHDPPKAGSGLTNRWQLTT